MPCIPHKLGGAAWLNMATNPSPATPWQSPSAHAAPNPVCPAARRLSPPRRPRQRLPMRCLFRPVLVQVLHRVRYALEANHKFFLEFQILVWHP